MGGNGQGNFILEWKGFELGLEGKLEIPWVGCRE